MHLSRRSLVNSTLAVLGAIATLSYGIPKASAALLIGNTNGNNVVVYDERSGRYGGEFISAASNLLSSPDDLTFGPDGSLYISSGNSTSGEILRFDSKTGEFLGRFDQGGKLLRPYGLAFGPDDNLYVSSFRSDEILRYDGSTGTFIDVFATGTKTANGLNGPNDLLFTENGDLYVTTQGSVADGLGGISFADGFASQVLRYNIFGGSATPIVFAQPTAPASSFGFVSLLGLAIDSKGALAVSDFANAIRRYDLLTGTLLDEFSSSYPGFMGNLTFDPKGNLYTPGFDFTKGDIGAISRFDSDGNPFPAAGQSGSVFVPARANLERPIGIAYAPFAVPEPGVTLGLLSLGAVGVMSRLKHRH